MIRLHKIVWPGWRMRGFLPCAAEAASVNETLVVEIEKDGSSLLSNVRMQ